MAHGSRKTRLCLTGRLVYVRTYVFSNGGLTGSLRQISFGTQPVTCSALGKLEHKVKAGASGVWGAIPMPLMGHSFVVTSDKEGTGGPGICGTASAQCGYVSGKAVFQHRSGTRRFSEAEY